MKAEAATVDGCLNRSSAAVGGRERSILLLLWGTNTASGCRLSMGKGVAVAAAYSWMAQQNGCRWLRRYTVKRRGKKKRGGSRVRFLKCE